MCRSRRWNGSTTSPSPATAGARTVAVRETGDTLACTNGSSLVYINGTPVRLDSPVVLTEDDCYLPAEAVTGYMRLFACTYDDEDRLLVIALADETAGLRAQNAAARDAGGIP